MAHMTRNASGLRKLWVQVPWSWSRGGMNMLAQVRLEKEKEVVGKPWVLKLVSAEILFANTKSGMVRLEIYRRNLFNSAYRKREENCRQRRFWKACNALQQCTLSFSVPSPSAYMGWNCKFKLKNKNKKNSKISMHRHIIIMGYHSY